MKRQKIESFVTEEAARCEGVERGGGEEKKLAGAFGERTRATRSFTLSVRQRQSQSFSQSFDAVNISMTDATP